MKVEDSTVNRDFFVNQTTLTVLIIMSNPEEKPPKTPAKTRVEISKTGKMVHDLLESTPGINLDEFVDEMKTKCSQLAEQKKPITKSDLPKILPEFISPMVDQKVEDIVKHDVNNVFPTVLDKYLTDSLKATGAIGKRFNGVRKKLLDHTADIEHIYSAMKKLEDQLKGFQKPGAVDSTTSKRRVSSTASASTHAECPACRQGMCFEH